MFLVLGFATLVLGAGLRLTSRGCAGSPRAGKPTFPFGSAYVFMSASFLVPLVILTLDTSKSPVVSDVLVAPVVWLVILSFVALGGSGGTEAAVGQRRIAAYALAALGLALGLRAHYKAYDANRFMSRHRADAESVNRMYDTLLAASRREDLRTPHIFNDCILPYLDADVARLLAYERHGNSLEASNEFSDLGEVPEAEVFRRLSACDFAMISRRSGPDVPYDYPFNREMERVNPAVTAYCKTHMARLGEYRVFDRDVTLFMRRTAP